MRASFQQQASQFSLGPFLKGPYPEMVECCALAGFDFAIADMEHTTLSHRELLTLVLAAQSRDIDLLVRIPDNLPMYYKWCLDLGVKYIQIPHIEDKDGAQLSIDQCFFAPTGDRGLCRFVRAADYSAIPVQKYFDKTRNQTHPILQIEGVRGVENIDEILSVKGIYAIFIGPYDLSQSMGHPGDIWHPRVVAAMGEIIKKCNKASIRVGTFADSKEGIEKWTSLGVQFIEFASDLNIFLFGAATLQSSFKKSPIKSFEGHQKDF